MMDWATGIASAVLGCAIAWSSTSTGIPRMRLRDLGILCIALVAYLLGAVAIEHFAPAIPLERYYAVGVGTVAGVLVGYGARYLAGPSRRGRVRVTKRM